VISAIVQNTKLCCLLFLFVQARGISAQVSPASRQAQPVSVVFAAFKDKRPVSDLTLQEVQIIDNKKAPASLVSLRSAAEVPMRLGLVLDVSHSQSASLRHAVEHAKTFLGQATADVDRVFLMSFSEKIEASAFLDRQQLSITPIKAQRLGKTALYDAVVFACRERLALDPASPARQSIVLISDGEDNHSKSTLNDAIAAAQAAGVTIYAVSTNDTGIFLLGDQNLDKLTKATGGTAYYGGTYNDVTKALDWIALQLRTQYVVTYLPGDTAKGFRPIRLSSSRKKMRITAPEGYYTELPTPQTAGKPR
jgi:Ca-activated chloride channel family protein